VLPFSLRSPALNLSLFRAFVRLTTGEIHVSLAPHSKVITVQTVRLELVRATLELLEAELPHRARFAAMLRVPVPADWPPGLNDAQSQQFMIARMRREGESDFNGWYIVLREPRAVIGNCGFKSLPQNGRVELGYSVVERFQRNGYCTEAIRALIAQAFTYAEVHSVVAQTLPHLTPSLRVMEKCGMTFAGEGEEDGMKTVRYEIRREQFR
jgi:RimJ/RimL family protein N-acetyltransferase